LSDSLLEQNVFWGAGSKAGRLLGVPAANLTAVPVDFRDQSGVYVLYADYSMVCVGQVGIGNQKLFDRLKQHKRDALAGRWNQFSWFGTRWMKQNSQLAAEADGKHSTHEQVLNHIEAILIHSAEPKHNRHIGRLGDEVVQYLQHRDQEMLGLTLEEMVREIWHVTPEMP
jgi:hypothetical protein